MINKRFFSLLALIGTTATANLIAPTATASTADTYAKTCAACHDSGALNAPKKGDKATWDRLIAQKGMAGLVQSTKDGMPQMPAKGLCNHCSDDEFKALIELMAK